MDFQGKSPRLKFTDLRTVPMRTFYVTAFAFFMCFFAWFGIVPFIKVIKAEFGMTQGQMWNTLIAGVAMTVVARVFVGRLCEKYGPRLCYTWLLIIGSLPVIGIAFTQTYEQFLIARLLIGCIGASFVITQYHCSIMFAPNCVGTANATSAGWGNLGGGVSQAVMYSVIAVVVMNFGQGDEAIQGTIEQSKLIMNEAQPFVEARLEEIPAATAKAKMSATVEAVATFLKTKTEYTGLKAGEIVSLSKEKLSASAWRMSMVIAGAVCFLTGFIYYFFTQDAPEGNFKELREQGKMPEGKQEEAGILAAMKDYRVWVLFGAYAACFGIELTFYNSLAIHLVDNLKFTMGTATTVVMSFGLMNIFARSLGGYFGDKFGIRHGIRGRVQFLVVLLALEGVFLCLFSQMSILALALPVLILFSLLVQMAEGATFTVVPFVDKKNLGSIAGIVGAGGNVGAVCGALLIKNLGTSTGYLILGSSIVVIAIATLAVRFSEAAESEARAEVEKKLRERELAAA